MQYYSQGSLNGEGDAGSFHLARFPLPPPRTRVGDSSASHPGLVVGNIKYAQIGEGAAVWMGGGGGQHY